MKTLDRGYLGTYIFHGWYVKFHIPPCTVNATKMSIIKIKTINLIFALSLTVECCYNPRQNYLRKFSPSCPLSYTTKLFPKQHLCASFKCPGFRLSFEYTTTLLSGEGGEGRTGTATMLRKMLP